MTDPRSDAQALIDALVDHRGDLDRFVYESTRGALPVEDITQETLLRATDALRGGRTGVGDLTPETLGPWLLALAEDVVRESMRGTGDTDSPDLPDPGTDPDAYVEALRHLYGEHVRRYVLGMSRNAYLSDDVTSETFERALRSARRDGVAHEVPIAWLKTIARNLLTDSYRRAVNRHEFSYSAPPETATVESADARLMRMESLRRLDAALDLLTPGQRKAIEMRTLNGYSTAEVASEMGRSEQAVRSLIHKATRVLINHYRDLDDTEEKEATA